MSTVNEMDTMSGWELTAESQQELFPGTAPSPAPWETFTPTHTGGRSLSREQREIRNREIWQVLDMGADQYQTAEVFDMDQSAVSRVVRNGRPSTGSPDQQEPADDERPDSLPGTGDRDRTTLVPDDEAAARRATAPEAQPQVTVAEMFDGRASLRSIRDNARNAGQAPFAVLLAVIIRLLACTPPSLTLPGIGKLSSPGSLNLYGAVTAASGGGKGEVMALAEHCLRVRDTHDRAVDVETFPIGSGEGLVAMFALPEDPEELPVTRAMAEVDEITELTALSGRTGATLQPKLLSMWSGKAVGNQNRSKATSQQAQAGRYRLTLLSGVQGGNAAALLNPQASVNGLPQRFVWASMTDHGFNMDTPAAEPVAVEVPAGDDRARSVEVCPEIREAIRADLRGKRTGRPPHPWDAHAIQCREIIGVALSLLDGRNGDVSSDDWRLSGLLWRHNRDTRNQCMRESQTSSADAAADRERVRDDARGQLGDDRMRQAREAIETALSEGGGRFLRSAVRNKGRRYRNEFDDVLTEMVEARQVALSQDQETGAQWVTDLR